MSEALVVFLDVVEVYFNEFLRLMTTPVLENAEILTLMKLSLVCRGTYDMYIRILKPGLLRRIHFDWRRKPNLLWSGHNLKIMVYLILPDIGVKGHLVALDRFRNSRLWDHPRCTNAFVRKIMCRHNAQTFKDQMEHNQTVFSRYIKQYQIFESGMNMENFCHLLSHKMQLDETLVECAEIWLGLFVMRKGQIYEARRAYVVNALSNYVGFSLKKHYDMMVLFVIEQAESLETLSLMSYQIVEWKKSDLIKQITGLFLERNGLHSTIANKLDRFVFRYNMERVVPVFKNITESLCNLPLQDLMYNTIISGILQREQSVMKNLGDLGKVKYLFQMDPVTAAHLYRHLESLVKRNDLKELYSLLLTLYFKHYIKMLENDLHCRTKFLYLFSREGESKVFWKLIVFMIRSISGPYPYYWNPLFALDRDIVQNTPVPHNPQLLQTYIVGILTEHLLYSIHDYEEVFLQYAPPKDFVFPLTEGEHSQERLLFFQQVISHQSSDSEEKCRFCKEILKSCYSKKVWMFDIFPEYRFLLEGRRNQPIDFVSSNETRDDLPSLSKK